MRKRKRPEQSMDDHYDLNSDDFLSRLPDEILVSILSAMPLKDAAATSQLSRRFRCLSYQSVRLDFVDNKRLDTTEVQPNLRLHRNKYINRVNRVIRQHRTAVIDEFKISFDLDKYRKGNISKWIEFALSKNVQKLELDLMDKSNIMHSDPGLNFVFPNKIFDRISESSLKEESCSSVPHMPSTTKVMEIKFLKVLILKSVNINDEAVSKILTSCQVLEHLSIHDSDHLVNVKISEKQTALIDLQISYCRALESIEICDSNLAYFRYLGSEINLKLNNVRSLKKLSIGEVNLWDENTFFQHLSSWTLYLQVLELAIYYPQDNLHLLSLPQLTNVRKLILRVGAYDESSLLEFTWLARACPNLQTFVIQLIWMENIKRRNRIMYMVDHPHQHLEVVEIGGYYGRNSDLELALYFIDNGVVLKKMVIDTYEHQRIDRTPITRETYEVKSSRFRARLQLLTRRLPHGLELVIR